MLSCDEGFVAVGVHHGNGELLQQPLPSGLPYMYYFCFGDEPGWGQFNGMHACRPGDGIVGAHNDHNVFTSVTARKPPHMEGEPLNPTVADIFLDSLGCDQVVSDGEIIFGIGDTGDEMRLYVNGNSIFGNEDDYFRFDSKGYALGRGVNRDFTSNLSKNFGRSLKLGTLALSRDRSSFIVVSMIEQGPQGEAKSALKMIDEGLRKQQTDNSKQSSDDELKEAARLLAQVAGLLIRAEPTRIVGTCGLGVRLHDDGLRVTWQKFDLNTRGYTCTTTVVSPQDRQARVKMQLGRGVYWLTLRVQPR